MKAKYDAIVAGAGPAGSTAAILLATAGWRVALVEKQSFPRRKVCGSCISAGNFPVLAALGIDDAFARRAGPELLEVAVYCGERVASAPLPPAPDARRPWGRALRREVFDLMLLERARTAGVELRQPWSLRSSAGSAGSFRCVVDSHAAPAREELDAPVLIMANGSWEPEPEGRPRRIRSAGDLFAFQADFTGSRLPAGVLPVISFPGGYGGLVIAEDGVLTLAGCIRRDALKACRAAAPGRSAGEAFERCLRERVAALREALDGAERVGRWLGAGPIHPGIRTPWQRSGGRFMIGNMAAEAHPIIGEGISMAMQSAWLLCQRLIGAGPARTSPAELLERIGRDYERQWKQAFAPRLRLAATLAQLAMRPYLAPVLWPAIVREPWVMTAMARGAGKARFTTAREHAA